MDVACSVQGSSCVKRNRGLLHPPIGPLRFWSIMESMLTPPHLRASKHMHEFAWLLQICLQKTFAKCLFRRCHWVSRCHACMRLPVPCKDAKPSACSILDRSTHICRASRWYCSREEDHRFRQQLPLQCGWLRHGRQPACSAPPQV